jgi:hypothetical protein
LAHDAVAHLSLPKWLNEGLAVTLERDIMPNYGGQILTAELADHHHVFWDEQNIQSFWAGGSFHKAGETSELSYNLAEVLLALIFECADQKTFCAFVTEATYADGGQTAALDILNIDLGDLAATFLGLGSWRPNRKAMVASWEQVAPPE